MDEVSRLICYNSTLFRFCAILSRTSLFLLTSDTTPPLRTRITSATTSLRFGTFPMKMYSYDPLFLPLLFLYDYYRYSIQCQKTVHDFFESEYFEDVWFLGMIHFLQIQLPEVPHAREVLERLSKDFDLMVITSRQSISFFSSLICSLFVSFIILLFGTTNIEMAGYPLAQYVQIQDSMQSLQFNWSQTVYSLSLFSNSQRQIGYL